MTERDGPFLAHILAAIADIDSFTMEGRSNFMSDRKTQSAVMRQLAIIGEAVKNLSPALVVGEPAVPWRQIKTSSASSRVVWRDRIEAQVA